MSIWNNLYVGTSGLRAHGDAISVVGDNIANVSTYGYKASRAGFADMMGGRVGTSRMGAGVRMGNIQTHHGQGGLTNTGGTLDYGIRGNGFFSVRDAGGTGTNYYSRDGRFSLDNNGFVVDPRGMRLQGYTVTGGQVGSQLGDLQLGSSQTPPVASTELTMSLNLDAGEAAPPAWDPADPDGTSNYSTSATVYDSLGKAHQVNMYFRTSGAGAWEWHAMVDGGELNGGTAGQLTEIADGTLGFTANGELDTETTNSSSADFLDAAPGQAITFDFGDAITTDGGTGLAGSTQFASASSVAQVSQDGYGSGDLIDVVTEDDGTITGVFSNGQRRPVAQVALALFASEDGLERMGNSLFAETSASGQALMGAAGSGGRGSISGGSLEGSNVDLADELVTLIAYQRAFQANVRTITTADEMMVEVSNLKR